MDIIRFAELADVPYIVDLSKRESSSLGFIPKMAYTAAITGIKTGKRWSNICNDRMWVCVNNGDLLGFCLASFGNPNSKDRRGKIAQICLQNDARKLTRGKLLLCEVVGYAAGIGCHNMGCGCADDLESNIFWKAMDWGKVGQRKGISHTNTWRQTSDRIVNIYHYNNPDQYQLFP